MQIPTAEAGEQKIEAVKKFLAEKGITEKNGRMAIWLAEQKSEYATLFEKKEETKPVADSVAPKQTAQVIPAHK